jgi:hypothetical protein
MVWTSDCISGYFDSWVSFVLINAYFGGALTMFFTSDVQLPFENLREVLQNIPDWKLVSITEMNAIYKVPATQVFSQTAWLAPLGLPRSACPARLAPLGLPARLNILLYFREIQILII